MFKLIKGIFYLATGRKYAITSFGVFFLSKDCVNREHIERLNLAAESLERAREYDCLFEEEADILQAAAWNAGMIDLVCGNHGRVVSPLSLKEAIQKVSKAYSMELCKKDSVYADEYMGQDIEYISKKYVEKMKQSLKGKP